MKWSEQAWAATAAVYDKILEHPFVNSLADGTLSCERFSYYIAQDAVYLENYSAVLAHIASRLTARSDVEAFLGFAVDGIAVERSLHEAFMSEFAVGEMPASQTCLLYSSVLKSQSYRPVEVEAAAVLPCFWIYQSVGRAITERNDKGDRNPYYRWIETYSDPAFEAATRRAIDICDALAVAASPDVRKEMTDVFVLCSKMEWLFWNSAWELEKWKI